MANPENAFNDNRPLVIGGAYNSWKLIQADQGPLRAGTVLGVVTATGFLAVCATGNGDGSEVARFVLTRDIDDIPAIKGAEMYEVLKAGVVNGNKLIFARDETLDDIVLATGLTHEDNLKDNGIIAIRGFDLELYDNT